MHHLQSFGAIFVGGASRLYDRYCTFSTTDNLKMELINWLIGYLEGGGGESPFPQSIKYPAKSPQRYLSSAQWVTDVWKRV